MKIIESDTPNNGFRLLAKELLTNGTYNSPRGLKTLELNDIWLILTNPGDGIISLPARKLNLDYLNAELAWYKSGDLGITEISKHSSFWERICNPDGTINSNYGYFVYKQLTEGKSQLEWCSNAISNDQNTRQAVINYNQPAHKYAGNKDFVCTLNQLFRQTQGKLDTTVLMRSNDMIYGLSYDLPWFTHVQRELADKTNLKQGKYQHFAASLHVYERHFKMLEEIANG